MVPWSNEGVERVDLEAKRGPDRRLRSPGQDAAVRRKADARQAKYTKKNVAYYREPPSNQRPHGRRNVVIMYE